MYEYVCTLYETCVLCMGYDTSYGGWIRCDSCMVEIKEMKQNLKSGQQNSIGYTSNPAYRKFVSNLII